MITPDQMDWIIETHEIAKSVGLKLQGDIERPMPAFYVKKDGEVIHMVKDFSQISSFIVGYKEAKE